MKLGKLITILVLLLIIGTSCQGHPSGSAIKIALIAPMSGAVPTFGASTRDGFLLAVQEWNAKGGLLGKKIETVVTDGQCSAQPAVNAANMVIQEDKVHYIIGEICSSATIAVSDIAERYKVVQISPTSTNTYVTINSDGGTKKYIFRACFIDPFQGLVMAKFAQGTGYKTAFIMYDMGNDYARGLAEAFEKAFTAAGGQILGKETYAHDDTDFSAILDKVITSKADVLYLPDYYNIVNLVGAQAKEKGVTAVMMGGDGWDSADLDVKAADGGFYSNHYDPGDTRQIVQSWIAAYQREYHTDKPPDALATLAYDATNLMITAIEKAGVDDTTKVAEALAKLRFEAVSGTITFDAQHNPIKNAAIIAIKNGKVKFEASISPDLPSDILTVAGNDKTHAETIPQSTLGGNEKANTLTFPQSSQIETEPSINEGPPISSTENNPQSLSVISQPENEISEPTNSDLTQIKKELTSLEDKVNSLPSSSDVDSLKEKIDALDIRLNSIEKLINANPEKAVSDYKISTEIQSLQNQINIVIPVTAGVFFVLLAMVLTPLPQKIQEAWASRSNKSAPPKGKGK